ncbi:MAG: PA domain-containing protein [Bryobacteraceae bacterium]
MFGSALRTSLLAALAALTPQAMAIAPVTLIVADPPGSGFNDATPAKPGGGNSGTTVGEQRLIALQHAVAIWSSKLDSPMPIRIRVSFKSLGCTAGAGTVGAAQTPDIFYFEQDEPEIIQNVWYPAALANRLFGRVQNPDREEIYLWFNPGVGDPDCLAGKHWYYGLDNHPTAQGVSFVPVALHEIAHGLGFAEVQEVAASEKWRGCVFGEYLYDATQKKTWNQMTLAERAELSKNYRRVSWTGYNVGRDAPAVLDPGTPILRIARPSAAAGRYYAGTASFGAALASSGIEGELALTSDGSDEAGPSPSDACSPVINVSEVMGRIAIADRGGCVFTQKAYHAQAAGAIALVVVNNVDAQNLPNLSGSDARITIPVVHVTFADGKVPKAALGEPQRPRVRLLLDPAVRRGADPAGRPLLYTPAVDRPGSSVAHWDSSASPDQLMEPDVPDDTADLVEPPRDLTLSALRDLGWFPDWDGVPGGIDQCPDSDQGATLRILSCDTGVANKTSPVGCRTSDFYKRCTREPGSRRDFLGCVDSVSSELLKAGTMDSEGAGAVRACAIRVPLP